LTQNDMPLFSDPTDGHWLAQLPCCCCDELGDVLCCCTRVATDSVW
jgi:hypothetical protein